MSQNTQDRTGYYCECYACGKSTDEYKSEQAAEDAWNRSRAEDLKDTELRSVYAVVIHPFRTWWQTIARFFFYLFGLFMVGTVLSTLTTASAGILYFGTGLFGAVWISFGSFYYIKYLENRVQSIRRLTAGRARIFNFTALIFAHLLVLAAYAALIQYFVIPFAEKCRYG
jgi:hypothetical protein